MSSIQRRWRDCCNELHQYMLVVSSTSIKTPLMLQAIFDLNLWWHSKLELVQKITVVNSTTEDWVYCLFRSNNRGWWIKSSFMSLVWFLDDCADGTLFLMVVPYLSLRNHMYCQWFNTYKASFTQIMNLCESMIDDWNANDTHGSEDCQIR